MQCYLDITQTPKKRYQEGGIFAYVLDVFLKKDYQLAPVTQENKTAL